MVRRSVTGSVTGSVPQCTGKKTKKMAANFFFLGSLSSELPPFFFLPVTVSVTQANPAREEEEEELFIRIHRIL